MSEIGVSNEEGRNAMNEKMKYIAFLFSALGVIASVIAFYKVWSEFHKMTDVRYMVLVQLFIAALWIAQGIVFFKKRLVNAAYIIVATVCLLISVYGLITTYTMTKYIVKSGGFEPEVSYEDFRKNATLNVYSTSINDGVWDRKIAYTSVEGGENVTPQLSFDKLPEARSYSILMIDESASNWLHWKALGITKNELAAGENLSSQDSSIINSYMGPYPPAGSGEHRYVIYVFALKYGYEGHLGTVGEGGMDVTKIYQLLDTVDGMSGNVLAYGYTEAVFSVE